MNYVSDYSKAVITPHEKIIELTEQRDEARYKNATVERLLPIAEARISVLTAHLAAAEAKNAALQDDLAAANGMCQHWRNLTEVGASKYTVAANTLELIATYGGSANSEGLVCNGGWCREQARAALDAAKEKPCH